MHLGATEIRALGTHDTAREAREDICEEFLRARYDLERLHGMLVQGLLEDDAAVKVAEYGHEAWLKSKQNREDYASGREVLLKEVSDSSMRSVIETVLQPQSTIWDAEEVLSLVDSAGKLYGLGLMAEVVHEAQRRKAPSPTAQLDKRRAKRWAEGSRFFASGRYTTEPTNVTLLTLDGLVQPHLARTMIADTEGLLQVSRKP